MKTNVTYSSLAAYDHIKAHITGECHRKILAVMLDELIYTRKQIARMLSMETSSIAGRVNELVEMGEIEVCGQIRCPVSGRMVEAIKLAPLQKELI
jgi:hypothetical protein